MRIYAGCIRRHRRFLRVLGERLRSLAASFSLRIIAFIMTPLLSAYFDNQSSPFPQCCLSDVGGRQLGQWYKILLKILGNKKMSGRTFFISILKTVYYGLCSRICKASWQPFSTHLRACLAGSFVVPSFPSAAITCRYISLAIVEP